LYHTAFLVPTRWELANLLRRIAETRTPIQGTSDHGTHLAIYLPDAEGNGIELAWDFPQVQWPKTFEEMMRNNRGLDPQALFQALIENPAAWEGLDPQTTVGHVHLHVAYLAPTKAFYHDMLGFGIPFDMSQAPGGLGDTALFFAAGDYHHHIGTNLWQGEGAPPPPENATGLRYFSVLLPSADEMDRVRERVQAAGLASETQDGALVLRDPAGNGLHFSIESD
jgi:catechol 2,3-dioxygenase